MEKELIFLWGTSKSPTSLHMQNYFLNVSALLHFWCSSESLFSTTPVWQLRFLLFLQFPPAFFSCCQEMSSSSPISFLHLLFQKVWIFYPLTLFFLLHMNYNHSIYWNLFWGQIVVVMTMPCRYYMLSEHTSVRFFFFCLQPLKDVLLHFRWAGCAFNTAYSKVWLKKAELFINLLHSLFTGV